MSFLVLFLLCGTYSALAFETSLNDFRLSNVVDLTLENNVRTKRSIVNGFTGLDFSLIPLGSQNENIVNAGQYRAYKISMKMPYIPENKLSNYYLHMVSLESTDFVEHVHFCRFNLSYVSSNVALQNNKVDIVESGLMAYQAIINFKQVSTKSDFFMDGNLIEVEMGTFAGPLVSLYAPNRRHYLTAGLFYGADDQLWLSASYYIGGGDSESLMAAEITNAPPQIMKIFDSHLLEYQITNPPSSLEIWITHGWGMDDVFHFGKIQIEMGKSMLCSHNDSWTVVYYPSLAAAYFGKILISNNNIFSKNLNDTNYIRFKIPFGIINTPSPLGLHPLHFNVTYGTSTKGYELILSNINITDKKSSLTLVTHDSATWQVISTSSKDYSSVQNQMLDIITTTYSFLKAKIIIKVPAISSMEVALLLSSSNIHIKPQKAWFDDLGYCVGPFKNSSTEISGNELSISLGIVSNPTGTAASLKVFALFSIGNDETVGNQTLNAKVNNLSLEALKISITSSNITDKSLQITNMNSPDNKLYIGSQAGISADLVLPSQLPLSKAQLLVLPDLEETLYDLRLCKVDIIDTENNLTCFSDQIKYEVSNDKRKFQDMLNVSIDQFCPWEGSRKFSVNFYYHLPHQDQIVQDSGLQLSLKVNNGSSDQIVSGAENVVVSLSQKQNAAYFEPYVQLSTCVECDQGLKGGVFSARLLIKLPKQCQQDYTLMLDPGLQNQVCLMEIKTVGKNFPCFQMPKYGDIFRQTVFEVNKNDSISSKIIMKGLTNWGKEDILKDNYADDNSIEIHAYLKKNVNSEHKMMQMNAVLEYSSGSLSPKQLVASENFSLPEIEETKAASKSNLIVEFENKDDIVFLRKPTLISFHVSVPERYMGKPEISVTIPVNEGEDKPQLCSLMVLAAGLNLPCLDIGSDLHFTSHVNENEPASKLSIYPELIHSGRSQNANESYVKFGVVVLVNNDGIKEIKIKVSANDNHTFATFPVISNFNATDSVLSSLNVESNTAPFLGNIKQKLWARINITLSRFKVIPLNLTIQAPHAEGRPIFTIEQLKLSPRLGNICCLDAWNINNAFPRTILASDLIYSFMQKDSVNIDFGFLANYGLNFRRETNKTDDDLITIDLLIQVTDHQATINNSIHTFDLHINPSSDNITFQVIPIKIQRHLERSDVNESVFIAINMDGNHDFKSKTFTISSVIQHSVISMAEAINTVSLDILLPNWLAKKLVNSAISYTTNYTGNHSLSYLKDQAIEITFDNGLFFPDIVSLDITLNLAEQPAMIEVTQGIILSHFRCYTSVFQNFPITNKTKISCSNFHPFWPNFPPPEKKTTQLNLRACDVQGSSALNNLYLPQNILANDSSLWIPAARAGPGQSVDSWKDYLIFSFGRLVEIESFSLERANSSFLFPSKVTLYVSNTGYNWIKISSNYIPITDFVILKKALQARWVKLVIDSLSIPYVLLMALKGITFNGRNISEAMGPCMNLTTPVSDNFTQYRHELFDPAGNLVYFCDSSPYKLHGSCFLRGLESRVVKELPKYVRNILGFSHKTDHMYFESSNGAIVSSFKGQQMEAVSVEKISSLSLTSPKPVPGELSLDIEDGPVDIDYDGIKSENRYLFKWKSCCRNT